MSDFGIEWLESMRDYSGCPSCGNKIEEPYQGQEYAICQVCLKKCKVIRRKNYAYRRINES